MRPLADKGLLKEREQSYAKLVVFSKVSTKPQTNTTARQRFSQMLLLVGSRDVQRRWRTHAAVACSASKSHKQPGLGSNEFPAPVQRSPAPPQALTWVASFTEAYPAKPGTNFTQSKGFSISIC